MSFLSKVGLDIFYYLPGCRSYYISQETIDVSVRGPIDDDDGVQALGDGGANDIASMVAQPTQIQEIIFEGHGITNAGARYIANALRSNTTLTHLSLSQNCIGDLGAYHLAKALERNRTLTSLSLAENSLGILGNVCLNVFPNPTLLKVYVAENRKGERVTCLLDREKIWAWCQLTLAKRCQRVVAKLLLDQMFEESPRSVTTLAKKLFAKKS